MRRILVLRGGALGDFLVTLPALALLRQKWPDAQIDFVGNATAAVLARKVGLINGIESQHTAPWHQLYGGELAADFRKRLAGYDLVISFWPDSDGELHRLFPLREGQRFIAESAAPCTKPASRHFSAIVSNLTGLSAKDWIALATPVPADVVAIHPGSGSPRKNWPMERWITIAGWLRDTTRLRPVFILGEAEADRAVFAGFESWRDLPLQALAQRLSRCRLFLGHDTGVSHLAAACAQAGLLLFGPTDPAIWAPPNPHFHVLQQGETLDAISVNDVSAKISAMLADRT